MFTVPEKQRTNETKQEKHGDRDWIRQITTEQGETEKRVRQTSRTGKIKNFLRQRTSNQGGKLERRVNSEPGEKEPQG